MNDVLRIAGRSENSHIAEIRHTRGTAGPEAAVCLALRKVEDILQAAAAGRFILNEALAAEMLAWCRVGRGGPINPAIDRSASHWEGSILGREMRS